jgi:MurNAc alpha-1-phosphate uridylyltransferase
MIKTAMVMAAGHGTRMQPLTDDRSKAMVEVAGRSLIDHTLDRAIVNVHAHADHLEAHLKARTRGPEIIISCERDELLETGGGVVKALPLLGDDPILICNIDAIWTEFAPVIQALFQAWDGNEMDDLFLLAPTLDCLGFDGPGDFDMDRMGQLDWRSGPTAPWVYAGVQIFTPARAKGYPQTRFSRTDIWRKTIARRRVYGLPIPGYWMHVGDPNAVKAAEAVLTHDSVASA